MRTLLTRRGFLATGTAFGALPLAAPVRAAGPVLLRAQTHDIVVNGKPARVLGVRQPDGTPGLTLNPGERFRVSLQNTLSTPTIIHWHGQTPPADQDGVPEFGVPALMPGEVRDYDYEARPGTHWMHSHQGLQEQSLLAGPLIVRAPEDLEVDEQEVVVLLQDFSFRSPEEILAGLTGSGGHDHAAMNMEQSTEPSTGGMSAMAGMGDGKPDLNDVDYDAYLANDRALDDPLVVRTERDGRVRLRLINGSASTAYWIDLGGRAGLVIAVDGDPVHPAVETRFPLAIAQRMDIQMDVPAGAVVPVFAQREGDTARTGILLAAPGAAVSKVSTTAEKAAPPVGLSLEKRLTAVDPLPDRPMDAALTMELTGTMAPYAWGIDGRGWKDHLPLKVRRGQRVAVKIVNRTPMAHPMHLHGHHFQIRALNGQAVSGAVRDTILVMPLGSCDLVFDADNPGRWLFHCHNLWHMATGMMTEVMYEVT